jgi:hypothetical protein
MRRSIDGQERIVKSVSLSVVGFVYSGVDEFTGIVGGIQSSSRHVAVSSSTWSTVLVKVLLCITKAEAMAVPSMGTERSERQ